MRLPDAASSVRNSGAMVRPEGGVLWRRTCGKKGDRGMINSRATDQRNALIPSFHPIELGLGGARNDGPLSIKNTVAK
jgi:hypothetical protein